MVVLTEELGDELHGLLTVFGLLPHPLLPTLIHLYLVHQYVLELGQQLGDCADRTDGDGDDTAAEVLALTQIMEGVPG